MDWKFWTRLIVATLFFVSTLWLVVGVPEIFNSPDERTNFVFSSSFAQDFSLSITEDLNPQVNGVIHPRSTVAIQNKILPTSFLGLPIVFGLVGAVAGQGAILFLTPLLALLAIVTWWKTIKQIFKKGILADLATIFIMIHPAFWLYSGRVMMHNVAFVALLIFATYFIFGFEKRKWWNYLSSGIFVGLALAFRNAEVIWVGLLTLTAAWYIWQKHSVKYAFIFLSSIVLVTIPFLYANYAVFGGLLETGYTVTDTSYAFEFSEPVEDIQNAPEGLLGYLFPFGIHELAILRHVYQYGFLLFPWMSLLSFLGIFFTILNWKKEEDSWKWLFSITSVLAIWLAVVYGSWTFNDNPDISLVTLGNSYVRYWLPLFILASPFAAKGIHQLSQLVPQSKFQTTLLILPTTIAVVLSFWLVFFSVDGLVPTRNHLFEFAQKREYILSSTENESIIIVDRADKFLFPERRVVVPLRSEQTYAAIPSLEELTSLYYFGITLPLEDIQFLEESLIPGMKIELIGTIKEESLYLIRQKQL